jgi:hypothetical protein
LQSPGSRTNRRASELKAQFWLWAISILIAIVLFLVAPLTLWNKVNAPNINEVDRLNNAMEKIRRNVMDPMGAIERTEAAAVVQDSLLNPFDCIDEACPYALRSWFVPLGHTEEIAFTRSILEKEGYEITLEDPQTCTIEEERICGFMGRNDQFVIQTKAVDVGAIEPPNKDVSPKRWRYVTIRLQKL